MFGEMGAEEKFQPKSQPYRHVVKLILWHSLETALERTLATSLSTVCVILYNYTWRSRLILNLYFKFYQGKNYFKC